MMSCDLAEIVFSYFADLPFIYIYSLSLHLWLRQSASQWPTLCPFFFRDAVSSLAVYLRQHMQSVQTPGQLCHFVPPAEVLRGVTVAENHLFRCRARRRRLLSFRGPLLSNQYIHATIKPALFSTEILPE